MLKICILGSGSMGTALAHLIGNNGHKVVIWSIDKDVSEHINIHHENKKFLPGVSLSKNVSANLILPLALADASVVIVALPTQAVNQVLHALRNHLADNTAIVSVSKGIDVKSGQTVSQIIKSVLPQARNKNIAALMGPLFATEISAKVPSVGLLATADIKVFKFLQKILVNKHFFVRYSDDLIGAELGGALKNIYAILLGVCDGLGYGWNTKSALMTAVVKEMAEVGQYLGGKKETFYGLAGMGDLLTTGFGDKSRNRRFGEKLCSGKSVQEAIKEIGHVVEGAATVKAVIKMLGAFKKQAPLLSAVNDIVSKRKNPCMVLQKLFSVI
ncbi:MAG TPA: glycerol-3-phosphate dehydrogenase [Candidatus Magasanikbacteria bacterium]|uniref:Glycerol-3-phosphate dehydrogenase [NAD(P)+] n=2 Tax=Candidatus Magasanikiibacteriota TaxID=1752731 RepID=A0A0G0ZJV7_9BACT|nr:MAG: Glycerol-3-phosphate dehydrogenase [NAD(P)+] [Candidatus Magasanikbacteria bacterium GW2011_GWC2_41_17]KKS13233.1 MAG: Glycerol-3-phosphate dehydrogenase [NAD(P)+] [Candidatus Magasanikbacteria bacterium GW2011_GWA2_41_55]HBV57817.1 glycerol-3-phosphate dehydrogenase [Candidatus Magasanikbacteria bacterium]HBX15978.1 glycerol-3-phosphate dehydrogenase [Candidatus Magasanikbacteria bacterium]